MSPAKPRQGGIWVGVVLIGLAMLSAALLAVGGSSQELLWQLGFIAPTIAIGLVTSLFSLRARAPKETLWFFGAVVAIGAVLNVVVPFAVAGRVEWGLIVPLAEPTGSDFLGGLYAPGAAFSATASWPPLTVVVGRAFTLADPAAALRIQVAVLVLMGLAAAYLSARLAAKVRSASSVSAANESSLPVGVFLVVALWLGTSYGFMFELERGNVNTYALLFSVLAVFVLVRWPRVVWAPALLLAVAINIKVYPAVLLVVLLWRFRWRALVPAIVSNVVLFLIAGPANASAFISGLLSLGGTPFLWAGNHSAASFAVLLSQQLGVTLPIVRYLLFAPALFVPAVLWVATLLVLVRQGRSDKGTVLMAASSVPIMAVFPTVSHDYMLVFLVLPLAVIVAMVATMRPFSSPVRSALFAAVSIELAYLARSVSLTPIPVLANKYPLLVGLQAIILVIVLVCADGTKDAALPAGST